MDKLTLMVDMDDVLYHNAFSRIVEEYLGRKLTKEEVDKNGYYLQNLVSDKEDFFNYFFSINMYDYADIVPHSQEVLKYLSNYYRIYVLTAYTFLERKESCGPILAQKFERLINDFPFLDPHDFCFVNDKKVVVSDVMVDDRLVNLKSAKTKILFDSFHNQDHTEEELNASGVIRGQDWQHIGQILVKKL